MSAQPASTTEAQAEATATDYTGTAPKSTQPVRLDPSANSGLRSSWRQLQVVSLRTGVRSDLSGEKVRLCVSIMPHRQLVIGF